MYVWCFSSIYVYICMHHFPGPPNDISRRRKREYYRIHWVNSSSVYIYYKEFHFALLFFLFLHHIKEFLCFSICHRDYIYKTIARIFTIRDVLLINIAVEKIDLLQWELSFFLFLFGITTTHFWWRNFLSIYLFYLFPFLFLSLCFTMFFEMWCI